MFKPDKVRFVRYEVLTTILWFGLDSSWLFEWRWAANILAVAAVLAAILTTVHAERSFGDLAVAFGILGWVLMNAFWVTGDMNKLPWAVLPAKVCAAFVFVCLAVAVASSRLGRETAGVLKKFRRVRF